MKRDLRDRVVVNGVAYRRSQFRAAEHVTPREWAGLLVVLGVLAWGSVGGVIWLIVWLVRKWL